jgi:hypothetical protein
MDGLPIWEIELQVRRLPTADRKDILIKLYMKMMDYNTRNRYNQWLHEEMCTQRWRSCMVAWLFAHKQMDTSEDIEIEKDAMREAARRWQRKLRADCKICKQYTYAECATCRILYCAEEMVENEFWKEMPVVELCTQCGIVHCKDCPC